MKNEIGIEESLVRSYANKLSKMHFVLKITTFFTISRLRILESCTNPRIVFGIKGVEQHLATIVNSE
jgi:hypothetical protein